MGHTPNTAGTFRKKSQKKSERPWKHSQSVSWNSLREYGWDPPSPIIQGTWGVQNFQNSLPLSTAGDASFFRCSGESLSELVTSHGIPSSTEGISDFSCDQFWGFNNTTFIDISEPQKMTLTEARLLKQDLPVRGSQSRLKTSISLEKLNLNLQNSPQK